jgi:hypothetical protein
MSGVQAIRLAWISCGSRLARANMRSELLVALPLVILLHFIERVAGWWPRRIEHPCAFGATPALKTLFFDPYHFAAHGIPGTPRDCARLCFCETRRSIGFFARDRDDKSGLFDCSGRGSAQVAAIRTHVKTELNVISVKITFRRGFLSVGYPTPVGIAISIRGRPLTVELRHNIHRMLFRVFCGSQSSLHLARIL